MQDLIKNKAVVVLGIAAAVFFIGTVGSCSNAYRNKLARDKEMLVRMESEEKLARFMQEKNQLEAKMKELTQASEAEKTAHQAAQKTLLQEQLVNQSLKDELQKLTKLKEALEQDLKELLATGKTSSQKVNK